MNTLNHAIEYAMEWHCVAIMEKNGKYNAASSWEDADYAEKLGWKYFGDPLELFKAGC